jgi:hypothetical protein
VKKAKVAEEERLKAAGFDFTPAPVPGIKRVPLFDLVNRMPDLGLMTQKLHRDDRQGRYFFMAHRQREFADKSEPGPGPKIDPRLDPLHALQLRNLVLAKPRLGSIDGGAWVALTLPDNRRMLVQVDEARNVVSQRPMTT